tara:strand:- start:88 stop:366 length:279 start_codon:yes stop_codon:yes gene_type:complete
MKKQKEIMNVFMISKRTHLFLDIDDSYGRRLSVKHNIVPSQVYKNIYLFIDAGLVIQQKIGRIEILKLTEKGKDYHCKLNEIVRLLNNKSKK